MCKIACTRKEASCILGNFFGELAPVCSKCKTLSDDDLVLITEDGLHLEGVAALTIRGHSSQSGEPATVKLTEHGFEFYGDIAEITRIRGTRCLYIGR